MPAPQLYIGIMSGTSLDGADAVLVDFSARHPLQLSDAHLSFGIALREQLSALCTGGTHNELEKAAAAGVALTHLYADAARKALLCAGVSAADVLAIGCHGQTVRHRPEQGFSMQLGNGALLAELTGMPVVTDFRSRDIAAGGQGAPLVPAFHQAMFHTPDADRVIVNVGGIANLTHLPKEGPVTGFDCGPGNVLMDGWILRHREQAYDADGAWASSGRLQADLLATLHDDPYFREPPPKSTGRERFNLQWLDQDQVGSYRPEDVQRTLLQLTVQAIADGITEYCRPATQVFICGGGACNGAMMEALRRALPDKLVSTTDELGMPVMNVEALAFAWLARQALRGLPGNLPAVTGARHSAVIGAIYPR